MHKHNSEHAQSIPTNGHQQINIGHSGHALNSRTREWKSTQIHKKEWRFGAIPTGKYAMVITSECKEFILF